MALLLLLLSLSNSIVEYLITIHTLSLSLLLYQLIGKLILKLEKTKVLDSRKKYCGGYWWSQGNL